MAKRNSDGGRAAVIWLATAYTCLIGLAPVCVTILVASENPQVQMVGVGIMLTLAIMFVIYKSIRWEGPVNRLSYWLFAHDRNDATDIYRAARRRRQLREESGTNQPPTLESVREAASQGGNWVPHSNVERRRSKKS